MEEGWTEKHTGGSLHAWRLTLSLSEPTENTKCYAPRHTLPTVRHFSVRPESHRLHTPLPLSRPPHPTHSRATSDMSEYGHY